MSSVRDRIEDAVQLLTGVSDTPRADAEFLMAHLLGIPRARLTMYLDEHPDIPEYRVFVERRLAYEPIPYILGEWEFFSIPIKTRAPILVPRPETEHLVEVVTGGRASLRATSSSASPRASSQFRILELCTGTGCVSIALALNLPKASITATDMSDEALALADENIRMHALEQRITLRKGDLFDALRDSDGSFDIICANPPYVEDSAFPGLSPSIRLYEDPLALLAGADGLDIIRGIIDKAQSHLVPRGMLALEIGDGQYEAVHELMRRACYSDIAAREDLAGIQRVIHARA